MSEEIEKVAGSEVSFFVPNTEEIGKLQSMKPEFSLILRYKQADEWAAIKDKPLRAFYMGLKEIPNEDGEVIKCGVFVSETECFISGQKLLVDAIKNLTSKTPVEIIYRGKSQNKSTEGSTMKFDVHILS